MLKQEHGIYRGGILAYVSLPHTLLANAHIDLYSDDMGLGT